jgi:hypothetical protein
LIGSVLAVLFAVALLVVVGYPPAVRTVGQVWPAREWLVVRRTDGALAATVRDRARGTVAATGEWSFARGDEVAVSFTPLLAGGASVSAGDTIAVITSAELAQQLVRQQAELAVAEARVRATRAGEKPSVIDEARASLRATQLQCEQQEKRLRRQQGLAERGMLPVDALEHDRYLLDQYRAARSAAMARVRTVEQGARDDDIAAAEAQVASLEQQLATLNSRRSALVLTVPFDGRLGYGARGDTLVALADTGAWVVEFAVRADESPAIAVGATVSLYAEGHDLAVTGRIARVSDQVEWVAGEGRVRVLAQIDGGAAPWGAGDLIRCEVPLPAAGGWSLLRRLLLG